MAPTVIAKRNGPISTSTAGILKVNPTTIQKATHKAQVSSARLKLVLRRLPPGLTKEEFQNLIPSEWHMGNGKVDWIQFCAGKTSRYDLIDIARRSRKRRQLTLLQ